MSEEVKTCPCCPRHCSLDNPSCGRGRKYAETGVIPERGERSERGERGERSEHGERGKRGEHGEHGGHGHHHDHGGHRHGRDGQE